MKENCRIVQIIPSDGWAAVFTLQAPKGYSETTYMPLICFALVEYEDGTRRVRGIDAESPAAFGQEGYNPLEFSDKMKNFCGYMKLQPDGSFYEPPDEWTPAKKS